MTLEGTKLPSELILCVMRYYSLTVLQHNYHVIWNHYAKAVSNSSLINVGWTHCLFQCQMLKSFHATTSNSSFTKFLIVFDHVPSHFLLVSGLGMPYRGSHAHLRRRCGPIYWGKIATFEFERPKYELEVHNMWHNLYSVLFAIFYFATNQHLIYFTLDHYRWRKWLSFQQYIAELVT